MEPRVSPQALSTLRPATSPLSGRQRYSSRRVRVCRPLCGLRIERHGVPNAAWTCLGLHAFAHYVGYFLWGHWLLL